MYHTKEILNMAAGFSRSVSYEQEPAQVEEMTTEKRRFGELSIGDLFVFDGLVIKKIGDLTAETNSKTGKRGFVFFKKDIVRSVVRGGSCSMPTQSSTKSNTGAFKGEKGGYDLFDREHLERSPWVDTSVLSNPSSALFCPEKPKLATGPMTIRVRFTQKDDREVIAHVFVDNYLVGHSIVTLIDNGIVRGRVEIGVLELASNVITENYLEFDSNGCNLYLNGRLNSTHQSKMCVSDNITICLNRSHDTK